MSDEQEGLHSGRFSIIPAAVLDDPRITPALLKLLCVLGTYGNKQGYCWPKRKTLAQRLGGISEPAITQNINKLKKYGYLEVQARFGVNGVQQGNRYRILFDAVPEMPSELTLGLAPEVTLGEALEVTPITSHSERPTFFNPSAAAINYPSGDVNPPLSEAAAAADDKENALNQTAEAVRRHLRMSRDKLPGLRLIVAQYPDARAWLENQANLCFETLKVRPLQLNHFSNWLDEVERRRNTPREDMTREQQQQQKQQSPAATDASERQSAAMDEEEYRRRMAEVVQRAWANAQRGGASPVPGVQRDDE